METLKLIEEFTEHLKARDLSESALGQYPRYILALHTFTNGDLLGVNEDVLIQYLSHLRKSGLKQSSIRRYFAVFSTFFDFLVYRKYIAASPITRTFRRLYLKSYKSHDVAQRRQCPTVEQAKRLVAGILDPKELAVVVLLLKTGLRRHELSELNIEDLDLKEMTIHVQPTRKRSNEILYYDLETSIVLERWLKLREKLNKKKTKALFLNHFGDRLSPGAIYAIVIKHATAVGLHKPDSKRLQDRLPPHALRHYFSTSMIEAGCRRDYVKELRGDADRDAVDTYYHVDRKKLRQAYLDHVPPLDLV